MHCIAHATRPFAVLELCRSARAPLPPPPPLPPSTSSSLRRPFTGNTAMRSTYILSAPGFWKRSIDELKRRSNTGMPATTPPPQVRAC